MNEPSVNTGIQISLSDSAFIFLYIPTSEVAGLRAVFLVYAPVMLQSRRRGWFTINYYRKDSPFLSLDVPSPHAHLLGSQCPPPDERRLSMPETGEKERNCLFKSYTNLE